MIDQAGNPEPDEPGEIGWPANAKHPHDPSVPPKGSGGAKQVVPDPTPPTLSDEAQRVAKINAENEAIDAKNAQIDVDNAAIASTPENDKIDAANEATDEANAQTDAENAGEPTKKRRR